MPRFGFRLGRRTRGPAVAASFLVLCGFGLFSMAGTGIRSPNASATALVSPPLSASERAVQFSMCGSHRYTCVVDGDTIWLEGQNLRMQSYDTPEPYTAICGGASEVELAKRASARLLELLNGNEFTVETFGIDGTGERTLATIRINGRDVGEILIAERLARRWPDGPEWWC